MRCLGLDVGSSTIKGAVLNLDSGHISDPVTVPFPSPVSDLPAGWIEISPSAVTQQVELVLGPLLELAPDANHLFFCGQMGGVILVSESGEPRSNYFSWRDQRTLQRHNGGTYLDSIRNRWPDDLMTGLGQELQPGSETSLLFWLSENRKLPSKAIPCSIADYVISHFCSVPPRMHVTQAIGLLDLRCADWHHGAFDRLGLGGLKLPKLSHDIEAIGTFHRNGREIVAFGAYGDQQCALYGADLHREELSINISTGSQVSRRMSSFSPGPYQTRMYFEGDWLNTITHLPAGRSLNVLVDLLMELAREEGVALKNPWETIIRKSGEVSSSDLLVDLAFFSGPLGACGSISNITTENLTVGKLFLAAFRAMAENYARCALQLDSSGDWKSVVLSGGLTQSIPRLKSLLLEHFKAPLRESLGEETLRGLWNLARL